MNSDERRNKGCGEICCFSFVADDLCIFWLRKCEKSGERQFFFNSIEFSSVDRGCDRDDDNVDHFSPAAESSIVRAKICRNDVAIFPRDATSPVFTYKSFYDPSSRSFESSIRLGVCLSTTPRKADYSSEEAH